jgi:hypothetical protein
MIPPPPLNIVPSVIATVIRNPFIKGAPTRSKIRPAQKRDLGAMVLANETKKEGSSGGGALPQTLSCLVTHSHYFSSI